jgi:hypothetical protein
MKSLLASVLAWFRHRRTRQVTPERARRRAGRGAAYLDDADPGWHRRLDAGALSLDDGRSCVLGQLHGSFRAGLGRARLFNVGSAPRASLSPVAYGFHCVRTGDEEAERRDYAFLNRAWLKEVRRRQEEDARRRKQRRAQRQAAPPARDPRREHDVTRVS